MAPILRNSPKSYRSCILYEVQLGRSMKEAYKNFCIHSKNDRFDCVEFVYWFNRFANEKIDLEDESFGKKPKSFSDLPMEILGEIIAELDLKSRLRTRKVSRLLRTVVDQQNARYDIFCISTRYNCIKIRVDDWHLYIKKDNGCFMLYRPEKRPKLLTEDDLNIALNDLAIALKKPIRHLQELIVTLETSQFDEIILKFFKFLKSPIHVKFVSISERGDSNTVPILSMLKPGTLESIQIGDWKTETNARRIVKMDQWKQAKHIHLGCYNNVPFGIEEFLHFDRVQCSLYTVSPEDVILLRDTFSKSADFEFWKIILWERDSTFIAQIGQALGAAVQQDPDGVERVRYRHPIPGSNEFLDFEISYYFFSIKRNS